MAPNLQHAVIREEGLGDMLQSPLGKMSSQSPMCEAGCGLLVMEEGVNGGTCQEAFSARTRYSPLLSSSRA